MNEKELIGKIHSAMYHQLRTCGYAAPVDVLIDTGILPKQKYEDWRFGRVRYLEAVCNANLKRLSFINLHQMRVYAQTHDLTILLLLQAMDCPQEKRDRSQAGHSRYNSVKREVEIEQAMHPLRRSGA